jgi:hypothetical protein
MGESGKGRLTRVQLLDTTLCRHLIRRNAAACHCDCKVACKCKAFESLHLIVAVMSMGVEAS